MSEFPSEVEVVIVGAGAAGLAAAKTLAKAGVSYVVLEASHRIGGRAYTEEIAPGMPFDLGCHWFHSASLNPLVAVADEFGFHYNQTNMDMRLFRDGAGVDEAARAESNAFFERSFELAKTAAQAPDDASVYDVTERDSPWTPVFDYFVSNWTSCDPDLVSVKDLANYNDTDENWPLREGMGTLIARYGAEAPAVLNAAVTAIDWGGTSIRVTTAKGTLEARKVLLTVSTGILGAGDISFDPPLPPSKQEAIGGLPLGAHNRIGVAFDGNPFGEDEPFSLGVIAGDEQPLYLRIRPFGFNYAVAMVGGRYADWLERAGEAAAVDLITETLKSTFGNRIADTITSHKVTAWRGDPWVRGAYSCAPPGQSGQRAVLAETLEERLYFAGEATSAEFFSTVHGAYLTGLERARAVITDLKGR